MMGCLPDKAHISEVESGVDTRIDAVISLWAHDLESFLLATGGVVVDDDGERWELSAHALHSFASERNERIWVVGDRGYIAYTDVEVDEEPVPIEWVPLSTGTHADLYAIEPTTEQKVAVGDDIVLIGVEQEGAFVWTQPDAPADGWGLLRGVSFVFEEGEEVPRYVAIGLEGRVLSSTPGGGTWGAVPVDTNADFHFVCGHLAVGSDLTRWTGELSVRSGNSSAEYVGLSCGGIWFGTFAVTSDRWLVEFRHGDIERVLQLPWEPRAFDPFGLYIAGDNGRLAYWTPGGPSFE